MEGLAEVRHLKVKMLHGFQPYEPIWHSMKQFTNTRNEQTCDELWVLQHSSVFTQGQAGKAEHVLAPGDIPVVKVDRGGQVTYHGPGQLVVYLLIDIARLGIGARQLVTTIESALINTLKAYDLSAIARQDAPGVYVNDEKIASLGLRIRKGRSFHGLSLNVDMDMEPFGRINPCGHKDLKMVQLSKYEPNACIERAAGILVGQIQNAFAYNDIVMEYAETI